MARGLKSIGKRLIPFIFVTGLSWMLIGCHQSAPKNINNACAIFKEYPSWYRDVAAVRRRWGTPASLILSIIYAESRFQPLARPARERVMGITWFHRSTALGYAQALSGAWRMYLRATNQLAADRSNFSDAVDFIGWYTHYSRKHLGISYQNGYAQYLAFHEGWGGYRRRLYRQSPALMHLAHKVQARQRRYRRQLTHCKYK